jgi:hypothetical protein
MLPWNFSEEGAAEKHMAQLQHNMLVAASRTAVLSIITGGGKCVEFSPTRFTSTCCSPRNGNSGAASKAASPSPLRD